MIESLKGNTRVKRVRKILLKEHRKKSMDIKESREKGTETEIEIERGSLG